MTGTIGTAAAAAAAAAIAVVTVAAAPAAAVGVAAMSLLPSEDAKRKPRGYPYRGERRWIRAKRRWWWNDRRRLTTSIAECVRPEFRLNT